MQHYRGEVAIFQSLIDLGNVLGVVVSILDAKYVFDYFGSIFENTNFDTGS